MNFSNVFVVETSSYCFGCLLVLLETRVTRSEGSHMLHYDLVGFCSEPVYLEPAKSQHLVIIFSVVDDEEVVEELLFCWEGGIGSNPILSVAHYEYTILLTDII